MNLTVCECYFETRGVYIQPVCYMRIGRGGGTGSARGGACSTFASATYIKDLGTCNVQSKDIAALLPGFDVCISFEHG